MAAPEALLQRLQGVQSALESIDIRVDAAAVLDANVKELEELQKDQLMQGKGADGQYLMRISNDPYFKSRAAADKYAHWKQRLTPETPFDRPNLFINGYTHATLKIERHGADVAFFLRAPWADDVAAKYHNQEMGLNKDSREWFHVRILRPALVNKYSSMLGAKIV